MAMGLFEFSLRAFTSMIIVMGPFSVIPVFISITQNNSREEIARIIIKAITCTTCICLIFGFCGTLFFRMFSISMDSFRIAGGLLLLIMGINMLHAKKSRIRVTADEHLEGVEKEDVSIFPLAIPLIAGPGSISTVVLLGAEATQGTFFHWIAFFCCIIVANLCLLCILKLSSKFYKVLGTTGINIMTRIMGLILASIAVEYILQGLRSFIIGSISS